MSKLYLSFAAALLLTACASSGPNRGDRSGDRSEMRGMKVATPMSLALTGMAADPSGVIDLGALPEAARAQFNLFDEDGSGTFSAIEHARWAQAILGDAYGRPSFLMMDRDDSRSVSEAEFESVIMESARRFDANHDGQLDRSELLREIPEGRRQAGSGDLDRMRQMQRRQRGL